MKVFSLGFVGFRFGKFCCGVFWGGVGVGVLVFCCAFIGGSMDFVVVVEFMGVMGLLGIVWENCALDIFRWVCCRWKLEVVVKGFIVLFFGVWLFRFVIF